MSKLWKNISGQDLTVEGVGVVKADETAEMPDDFRNGNFERVESAKPPTNSPKK